jgi:hypothetical protein
MLYLNPAFHCVCGFAGVQGVFDGGVRITD